MSEYKGPIKHPLEVENETLRVQAEVLYRDNVTLSETADALRAENTRLREALEILGNWECDCEYRAGVRIFTCAGCIARAALEVKP